jgi:hypothetical protein
MSSSFALPYPSNAYLLSLIGGMLIVVFGLVELAAALLYSSIIESIVPGSTPFVAVAGVVAAILGLVIMILGLRLKSNPASAHTSGVLIIVLSLFSYVGGGGFFIGLILALIGGVLALRWHPPRVAQPFYGQPAYDAPLGRSGAASPWSVPASPPLPPDVARRFCSSCGSPNVASARFCAKCGAPMT